MNSAGNNSEKTLLILAEGGGSGGGDEGGSYKQLKSEAELTMILKNRLRSNDLIPNETKTEQEVQYEELWNPRELKRYISSPTNGLYVPAHAVTLWVDKAAGRIIVPTPDGTNGVPHCLMHTNDQQRGHKYNVPKEHFNKSVVETLSCPVQQGEFTRNADGSLLDESKIRNAFSTYYTSLVHSKKDDVNNVLLTPDGSAALKTLTESAAQHRTLMTMLASIRDNRSFGPLLSTDAAKVTGSIIKKLLQAARDGSMISEVEQQLDEASKEGATELTQQPNAAKERSGISELEQQLAAENKRATKLEQQLVAVKEGTAKLEGQLIEAKESTKISELERQLAHERIAELRSELATLRDSTEELSTKLVTANYKLDHYKILSEAFEELKKKYSEKWDEAKEADEAAGQLQDELTAAQANADVLSDQVDAKAKKLAVARELIRRLQQELASAQRRNGDNEIVELRADLQHRDDTIAMLRADLQHRDDTIAKLRGESLDLSSDSSQEEE